MLTRPGPYFLAAIPGGQPTAAALKDFGQQTGNQLTWNVDLPAGTSVTIRITDSTGGTNYNSAVTIREFKRVMTRPNTDIPEEGSDSCMNGASSSAAAGGAGGAVASGASSAPSASGSTAAASASSAAGSMTSSASSAASTASSASRAASSGPASAA